jgi:hypothetical protein
VFLVSQVDDWHPIMPRLSRPDNVDALDTVSWAPGWPGLWQWPPPVIDRHHNHLADGETACVITTSKAAFSLTPFLSDRKGLKNC